MYSIFKTVLCLIYFDNFIFKLYLSLYYRILFVCTEERAIYSHFKTVLCLVYFDNFIFKLYICLSFISHIRILFSVFILYPLIFIFLLSNKNTKYFPFLHTMQKIPLAISFFLPFLVSLIFLQTKLEVRSTLRISCQSNGNINCSRIFFYLTGQSHREKVVNSCSFIQMSNVKNIR